MQSLRRGHWTRPRAPATPGGRRALGRPGGQKQVVTRSRGRQCPSWLPAHPESPAWGGWRGSAWDWPRAEGSSHPGPLLGLRKAAEMIELIKPEWTQDRADTDPEREGVVECRGSRHLHPEWAAWHGTATRF